MALKFHYKGLTAEDRVFALTPEVSVTKAKGTLYEAWFDVLKSSPWYRELCETGVFPSPSAEEVWIHFGDLRKMTFQEWWLSTGYRIFAEEIDYRPVEVLSVTTKIKNDDSAKKPPTLIIEVPLNLAPAVLREQFDQILRRHAEYLVDFDRWEHSTASVHQHRESKLNYKTILGIGLMFTRLTKRNPLNRDSSCTTLLQICSFIRFLSAESSGAAMFPRT